MLIKKSIINTLFFTYIYGNYIVQSFEVKESEDKWQLCEVVFNIMHYFKENKKRKISKVQSYTIHIKPLDNREREIYLHKNIQNTNILYMNMHK